MDGPQTGEVNGGIADRPVTWQYFFWIAGGFVTLICTYILTHGMQVHRDAATIRELSQLRERVTTLEVELRMHHRNAKRGPYEY